ncbi:MAG: hypothetical protein RBS95_06765, partial [Desulfobulbus sp.]|nr:hypothetical protein [Desulfobulbus sp.]
QKTDVLIDQGDAFREQGELQLGHGSAPIRREGVEIVNVANISESAAAVNRLCSIWKHLRP